MKNIIIVIKQSEATYKGFKTKPNTTIGFPQPFGTAPYMAFKQVPSLSFVMSEHLEYKNNYNLNTCTLQKVEQTTELHKGSCEFTHTLLIDSPITVVELFSFLDSKGVEWEVHQLESCNSLDVNGSTFHNVAVNAITLFDIDMYTHSTHQDISKFMLKLLESRNKSNLN